MNRPWFGVWKLKTGITVVLFKYLFQIKLVSDELFSQRYDNSRIRIYGLSVKLFG